MPFLPFEVQHGIDQVLKHPRARDRSLLRHVPHEKDRDPRLLPVEDEPARALAHLPHGPARREGRT